MLTNATLFILVFLWFGPGKSKQWVVFYCEHPLRRKNRTLFQTKSGQLITPKLGPWGGAESTELILCWRYLRTWCRGGFLDYGVIRCRREFYLSITWNIEHRWNAIFYLSFLILRESVGLPGRGISPTQDHCLHRTTQTQNKSKETSIPWEGFEPWSSGRRHSTFKP
jgi:hypothetical protein